MRTPKDFVRRVQWMLQEGEICILYAVAFDARHADPDKIWSEMMNRQFREAVLALLPTGEFFPPDDLDDWVFIMYPLVTA